MATRKYSDRDIEDFVREKKQIARQKRTHVQSQEARLKKWTKAIDEIRSLRTDNAMTKEFSARTELLAAEGSKIITSLECTLIRLRKEENEFMESIIKGGVGKE